MIFLNRLILDLLSFLLIQIPLQIIGMMLLLIFLPLKRAMYRDNLTNSLMLPAFLRWFDNADLYLSRDTTVYILVFGGTFWSHYLWLAWRNPINYFSYKYLGFQWTGEETYVILSEPDRLNPDGTKPEVGDTAGRCSGFRQIELSSGYYEYLYIKRIGSTRCLYLRMGWKIQDQNNPKGSWTQQVFTVSLRSYSGV